jgi:DNA-binding protein Fis
MHGVRRREQEIRMTIGRPFARFASIAMLALLAGCSAAGWRAQEIDGSSQPAFEASVTSLQERLAPHRRAELETSLAIIWLRRTSAGAGDTDSDGSVDVNEIRVLQQAAEHVFEDVRRGVFAFTTEDNPAAGAEYVRQLDGLSYDDVIDLAAATSGEVLLDAVREQELDNQCRGLRRVAGSPDTWTDDKFRSAVISKHCRTRR